jgi:DNA-binding SARP family transcriptional activator
MIRFRLLGPVEVTVDGETVALGGPKQRAVLAVLLAASPNVVSVDRMLDSVWGPSGTPEGLQVSIAKLRKALRVVRPDLIETVRPGYRIIPMPGELDLEAFRTGVDEGRRLARSGDHDAAVEALHRALELWRGPFASDLTEIQELDDGRHSLERLRVAATADRLGAQLAIGRHVESLPELDRLVKVHPLDERLRGIHMLALYRSVRQAEALDSYREIETQLVEELGVRPGPEIESLELRILRHDEALLETGSTPSEVQTTVKREADSSVVATLSVAGRIVELTKAVTTIGRLADRGVVVNDRDVSRRHAEIRRVAEGHRIVDVGSTNGTYVNSVAVIEQELRSGDVITVGSSELRYENGAADLAH